MHAVTTAVTSNAKLPCYVQKTFYISLQPSTSSGSYTFPDPVLQLLLSRGMKGCNMYVPFRTEHAVLISSAPWIIMSFCVDLL